MDIEVAKSGRAKCKRCEEPINKGNERVGLKIYVAGHYSNQWLHPECFMQGIECQEAKNNRSKCKDEDCAIDEGIGEKKIKKGTLKIGFNPGNGKNPTYFHLSCGVRHLAKVVSIVKQSSDDADRVMVKVDGRDSISSDNKEALIAGLKSINVCIGNGDRAGADANSGTTAIGKGKEEEGQRVTGKKRNIDSEGTGAQCAGKSGCDDIHDDGTGSEQTKRKTKSNKKMKREDGATKPKNKKRVRDDFIPTPSTVTPSAKSERDTLSLSSLSSSSPLRGLTVLAYNVNGIRAALKRDLSTYLQRVDADILCLTEVKCEQHECPVDEDEWKSKFGYEHVYWSSSQERKGYAGSAVLSKVKPSSVTYGVGSGVDSEGRAVTLEFNEFFLVLTYVPNSGDGLKFAAKRAEWDTKMRIHLNKLNTQKPVIWAGDLNVAYSAVDVYDGRYNKKRNQGAGFTDAERLAMGYILQDDGYVDVYRHFHPFDADAPDGDQADHYTFWSYRANMKVKNKGWRLDYFIVSPDVVHAVSGIKLDSQQAYSDHAPLLLTMK